MNVTNPRADEQRLKEMHQAFREIHFMWISQTSFSQDFPASL